MMLNRLLACLALLTGLTVLGTPAYAREAAVMAAQMEQRAVPALTQVDAAKSGHHDTAPRSAEEDSACPLKVAQHVLVPAVLFGPDRALE